MYELRQVAIAASVEEGSERSRRGQRVAVAEHDPGTSSVGCTERADERRLTSARFSGDEHHAPVPEARVSERLPEHRELGLTLEQADLDGIEADRHVRMLPVRLSRRN